MLQVTAENKGGKALEEEVEEEIMAFDAWFQKGGREQVEEMVNDPLIKSERAILKTALWYFLHRDKEQATCDTLPAPALEPEESPV